MISIGLILRRACGQRKRLRNFFPQVHLVPLCSLGDSLSSSSDTSSIGSPWRSPLRPSESNRSRAIFLALFHSRKSCSFTSSKVLFTEGDSCWFSWVDTTGSRGIPWESACAGDPLSSSSETPSITNKNNYMYLKECPWSTTTNRKPHKKSTNSLFFLNDQLEIHKWNTFTVTDSYQTSLPFFISMIRRRNVFTNVGRNGWSTG